MSDKLYYPTFESLPDSVKDGRTKHILRGFYTDIMDNLQHFKNYYGIDLTKPIEEWTSATDYQKRNEEDDTKPRPCITCKIDGLGCYKKLETSTRCIHCEHFGTSCYPSSKYLTTY